MTDISPRLTVYTANDRNGGLATTIVKSAKDIYRSRHLIWCLFARDFKAQFKQNLLGYYWAVINPMVAVFAFIFMNYAGILRPGPTEVPYPVYAFVGTSIWGFLTGTITFMSGGLRSQSELILRTNIPKIALAASSLANIGYSVVVNMAMIVLLMTIFHVPLTLGSLAFPFLILPIIILGVALGLVISVIGIIVRDAGNMATQFFIIGMYLTPVIYVADTLKGRMIYKVIMNNPLTYVIDLPRSILFGHGSNYWPQYLGVSALALIALILSLKVFEIIQDLVAERL